jgi:hypothetical protein
MKTPEEINDFVRVANAWMEANPKESKFRYAVNKVAKSCIPLLKTFEEQREEINIEHCSTDKDGVILRDDKGGFRFTKDGLKARNKAVNALFRTPVEIEPYYATEVPGEDVLSVDEYDAFVGFVVHEKPEPSDTLHLVNGAAGEAVAASQ